MKMHCPKSKKDLREKKSSVAGIAEGSDLFNEGDVFLATAKSLRRYYQPCKNNTINIANGTHSWVAWWGQYEFACLISSADHFWD